MSISTRIKKVKYMQKRIDIISNQGKATPTASRLNYAQSRNGNANDHNGYRSKASRAHTTANHAPGSDDKVAVEPVASTSSTRQNRAAHDVENSSPNAWFAKKFPSIAEIFGAAISITKTKGGEKISGVSEDFLAATLGAKASPESPVIFLPAERRFYQYIPNLGLFALVEAHSLAAKLSTTLRSCADGCESQMDVQPLKFQLAKTSNLNGAVVRAKALLAEPGFFDVLPTELIACRNGILQLSGRKLLKFDPTYHFRTKLAVDFVPGAKCDRFIKQVLKPTLATADLDLLQRFFGMALLGQNPAQTLLILVGQGGDGKGVCVRILRGILGSSTVASLRTTQLTSRFEIGRLSGRTLLYGADVRSDFLNNSSAFVIKSLTGGDFMTGERKNSNTQLEIAGHFNVLVTCNARPRIMLDGDIEAWRRRLRIIRFKPPSYKEEIPDLSEQIVREEGPGVLNFMLAGLDKLRAADYRLDIKGDQVGLVDDLLMESQSHVAFANSKLKADPSGNLTVSDCYDAYSSFCAGRQWTPMTRNKFGELFPKAVQQQFGLTPRNDIRGPDNKAQRGWKGVAAI